MAIPKVSLSLGGNWGVAIALIAVLLAAAFLFYRYTLPPLPPARRMVLTAIRALALTLLILIFFEPVFRLVLSDEQPPAIAVLVDNSQSMTVPSAHNRSSEIKPLLKGGDFDRLPSGAALKVYLFASGLQPLKPPAPDSLTFSGEITDLSGAMVALKNRLSKENIRAVALISDGNYTAGRNPLYDAEALGVPVFTVGIGDTNEQKDILVQKVVSNSIAYSETRVPVDVTVKSSGYNGENVEVTVAEGSSLVDRTMVKLKEGVHEYSLRLFVEPKEEGTKKYTVKVSGLPGELTEKNNARSFFVKVLKSKLKILLLAGAPSPDVSAVRQALTEDGHFRVTAFIQKSADEFYETAFSQALLDSADCLVLIGYPSAASSNALLEKVREAADREKKPLLFINSKSTDYTKLRQLETLLPFSWSGTSQNEMLVGAMVAPARKNHPLIVLEGNATEQTWQQLPPIYKTQTVFRAKPESDVLVSLTFQNVPLGEPLMLTRNLNGQKSCAITGHGIWRWRLLVQDNTETGKFFPMLMGNAVRWLTTKEDQKRVRIAPVKEAFTTADPAEFTGQVYDEQLRPVENAEVVVELERDRERSRFSLNAVGNGRYEGAIEGLAEGDYVYRGSATVGGTSLGEDRGKFSVGQVNVEFLQTRMNKPLLEQIAYQTGGKYYDIDRAEELARDLATGAKLGPKETVTTSEIELWNWHYLAALVILLFAVEWFLRKRSGML
ncbi:MAG: VWA domain-containing protein [Ignavibacteria bacterium]|nr:MAG: VWA domain-containing protein [Ignavibacteria bacterium]